MSGRATFYHVQLLGLVLLLRTVAAAPPAERANRALQRTNSRTRAIGHILTELDGRTHDLTRRHRALTAAATRLALLRAEPIAVALPIGTLKHGRLPSRWRYYAYPSRGEPEPSRHAEEIYAELFNPHLVAVGSQTDLLRLNAVERLTTVDTSSCLTDEEQRVAQALRDRAGGVHGVLRLVARSLLTFAPDEYQMRMRGPWPWEKEPGLYDVHQRDWLYRPRRLSAYEAMGLLKADSPLLIRSAKDGELVVNNLGELLSVVP